MSALDIQIGGEHYKNAKIQPVQYIEANGLGFLEGCVVKRITRHDKPTGKGRQDIEKAIHELQLLLEFRYPQAQSASRFDPASPDTADALKFGTAVHAWLAERPEVYTMSNPPGGDIYAEFAARVNATERKYGPTPVVSVYTGIQPKCAECLYPTDAAGTHYATCSQLTAPEEYKAEAQVAFDEAAEISEALARQVSAGTLEAAAKNPSIIDDYEEWHCLVCGAVHTRIGHTHQRIGFNPCNPWCPEPVRPEEPAAAMDDDSPRMQAIGQNGNNGEHYDDPFAGAPEWAKYKAQDADGRWFWYEHAPNQLEKHWAFGFGSCGRLEEVDDAANPNWRDTLITRT